MQASWSWNIRLDQIVKEFRFDQSMWELCVFKKASGSTVKFMMLYVIDILIMHKDIHAMSSVKVWSHGHFYTKDLSKATWLRDMKSMEIDEGD